MKHKKHIIMAICIIVFVCSLVVFAQRNVQVFESHGEGDAIISVEARDGAVSPSGEAPMIIIDANEAGKAGNEQNDRNSNNRRRGSSDVAEDRARFREMRNQMRAQEGDINPGQKKWRENNANPTGQGMPVVPGQPGAPPSVDQKVQQPQQQVELDGLQRYLESIVKKNLFLPLGSGGEAPKQAYALTGVISNTSGGSTSKAIIEQVGGNRSFYVSTGESLGGDAIVKNIEETSVKLDRSGEELTLSLGVGTQGGGGGGPRGGGPKGGAPQPGGRERKAEFRQAVAPGPGDFDASKIPPFVQKMLEQRGISIEELKNNPELQQKLKSEFEQRFRGGAPGGAQ